MAVSLLLCLLSIYFISQYNEYQYLQSKYTASSEILNAYTQNLNFYIQSTILVTICVFCLLCFSYFYFVFKDSNYICDNLKPKDKPRNPLTQITAICLCVLPLFAVKFFIYPPGSSTLIPGMSSSDSKLNEEIKSFSDERILITLGRISNYKFEEECILNKTFAKIEYQNNSVLELFYHSPLNDVLNYSVTNIDTKYTKYDKRIGTANIMKYDTKGIVFLENDKPHAVKINQINNHSENKILTEAVKELILEGYWDYFEYGCDYLLEYDPEFIKPYIERYSQGEFTKNELEINKDIKTEYMVDFAKIYSID